MEHYNTRFSLIVSILSEIFRITRSQIIILIIIGFFTLPVKAQHYIPFEILHAVEKGTRTLSGVPGDQYFQNHASYNINVQFDPKSGILTGEAVINYFNESPDSLYKIVMRLYQNLYKKGGIRDEEVDQEVIHNGVIIKTLRINNEDFTPKLSDRTRTEGTIFTIFLKDVLVPGKSCRISMSWEFTMPDRPVKRFGKYGEGSFFVSLWYPQVAVYDDINGWDENQYTGTQEFYNDFNDYSVSVTVPRAFMVWATGDWINAQYILSEEVWTRFMEASSSEKVVHIIKADDLKKKSWYSGKGSKTFRFKAENIPDFAFGVSNNYLWDATTAWIDSDRKVVVSAAYPEGAANFNEVAGLGREIIRHLNDSSYGIPYPYPSVTVFNGEGGMEYPMIVNDGTFFFLNGTIFVTMHEIAHAYFPFFLGINENKYSWIDEGLTTYLPMETEEALGSDYYTMEHVVRKYNNMAGTFEDIPFSVPASQTRGESYINYSYIRSSLAFYMLENYIGRDTFRLAIRNFADIWQYKHPTPYDLLAVIKKTSNRDIDWFIDPWFFGFGYPDLAIGEVEITGKKIKVEILKLGLFPVPVVLEMHFLSGEKELFYFDPEIWKEKDTANFSFVIVDELESITLGSTGIPDKNPLNNVFTISSE